MTAPTAAEPTTVEPTNQRRLSWALMRPTLVEGRGALARLGALSLVEALPTMASGQLVAHAVDEGFLAHKLWLGLLLLGIYGVVMVIGAFASRQAMNPLSELVESLRDHLVSQVIMASLYRAVRRNTAQDASVVTRITAQTEIVRQYYAALLMVLRTVAFSIGATMIGLLSLRPEFAGITTVSVLLAGVLLVLLARVLRTRYRRSLVTDEELATTSSRVLSGLRDVRACGAADTARGQVGVAVDTHARASMSTARAGASRIGIVTLGARVPLALMLVLAPTLVHSGTATAGDILGAGVYFVTGLEPAVRQLVTSIGNMGLQFGVVLHRLAEYCADTPADPDKGELRAHDYDLQLRDVTFAYGPNSAPIVQDLSIDLTYGCHVALVGPSGIGKSTLANLLAGMERPQVGDIYLGGVPLRELNPDWMHRAIALVPQEHYVFAGTMRENLTYLEPEAGKAALDDAVDRFGLLATVERIGGYDSPLGPVDALSAGERQLITLARIYLAHPQILILDEATCYLDPVAEAKVESAFMATGCTMIVIAHRISSAMRAEQVLVLDGITVALGSHEEMLAASRLYADLAGRWAENGSVTRPTLGPGQRSDSPAYEDVVTERGCGSSTTASSSRTG